MTQLKAIAAASTAALLMLLALGGSAIGADEPTPAPLVEAVVFIDTRGQAIEDPSLPALVETRPGVALDLTAINRDLGLLVKKMPGYLEVVAKVQAGTEAGRARVVFEFLKRKQVRSVRIVAGAGTREILGLGDRLSLASGAPLRNDLLLADLGLIKKEYARRGYPSARVDYDVAEVAPEAVDVVFTVGVQGSQRYVAKLKLREQRPGTRGLLTEARALVKTRAPGLLDRLRGKKRKHAFDPETLAQDVDRIRELYLENGHAEVQVEPRVRDSETGGVTIEITVAPRRRLRFGKVEVSGLGPESVFKAERVREALAVSGDGRSEALPYSEKALSRALERVRDLYGELGYGMAQVEGFYDGASETLLVRVAQGERQTVTDIRVEGNERTDTRTILEDISVVPGRTLNTRQVAESVRKLKKRGYFETVVADFDPVGPGKGVLVIRVEEARTRSIAFGVGAGESGLMGNATYGDRNIGGKGVGVSVNAYFGEHEKLLRLVYDDAHLLGSDNELRASATAQDRKMPGYGQFEAGGLILVEREIAEGLKAGLGFAARSVTIRDADPELVQIIHQQTGEDANGRDLIHGLVSSLQYERQAKDRDGNVVGGYQARVTLKPSLADGNYFHQLTARAAANWAVHKDSSGASHVVSAKVTLGIASDQTPFYEKFYAGGTDSIRGFRYRGITGGKKYVGGKMLATSGLYYSVPLNASGLRGVVFVEGASVGDGVADLKKVRLAAGAGLSMQNLFMGVPIEGGIALPILKQDEDGLQPFYLIIGKHDPIYGL